MIRSEQLIDLPSILSFHLMRKINLPTHDTSNQKYYNAPPSLNQGSLSDGRQGYMVNQKAN
ncbi:MAG: hypothetical protein HQ541_04330 [Mariniphaga sp.]|nr:hypothetical protein [Mariniphaga sp.]